MTSYALLPAHFTNAKYHRRCGVHVQTLLLCHEPITLLVTIAAISIGVVLLVNPNYRKALLYKQFFEHYVRVRGSHYILLTRIAIISWIAVHSIHVIAIVTTVLATQLIRPELLYPQLLILIISVGFCTFSLLAIITMNFIGSNIIWMTPFILFFFGFITFTNLYLIVLTHRYVADRREVLQKILKSTKTVKFKETHSSIKLYDEY